MKKFARPALALAVTAGLTLSGAAAAQAATAPQPAVAPAAAQAAVPTSVGLCPSCCEAAKTLHWTAEWVLKALWLQPVFSLIDKPIIHPLLWKPIDFLTGGCGVDSHPEGLTS